MAEEKKYVRPSWDEYFMEVVRTVAKRATCDRGRSGCVIVKDKHILVTGYVGAPRGLEHCDDVGHLMKDVHHEDGSVSHHCVRTLHAEQNAIAQAAKLGVPLEGSTMYCKMAPCRVCSMFIVNCGIEKVVAEKRYHQAGYDILEKGGVELVLLNDEVETYEGMTEKAKE